MKRCFLFLAAAVLVFASACKDDPPPAVTPAAKAVDAATKGSADAGASAKALTADEKAWAQVQADAAKLPTTAERMQLFEDFMIDHPASANADKAFARMKELRKEGWSARPRENAQKATRKSLDAAYVALAKSVREGGSIADVCGAVLVQAISTSRPVKTPASEMITLSSPTGYSQRVDGPVYLGLSSLRYELSAWLARQGDDSARCGHECVDNAASQLLSRHLGGKLFKEPGVVDGKVLGALLAAFDLGANDRVLGVTSKALYGFVRPSLAEYLAVYRVLVDKVGRDKVLAAYQAKLKATAGTEKKGELNKPRIDFYRAYPDQIGLADQLGTDLYRKHALYIPTGFWMRRMADGTDKKIAAFIERKAKELTE